MLDRVDTPLATRVKERIRAHGPITFREFMDVALYDHELGFYARGPAIGTPGSAFSTSAKYPAFAYALARAVREADRRAGEPLRVVEFGGGSGELAWRMLDFLGDEREYVIVDASAGLRAVQAAKNVTAVPHARELASAPTFAFGNEVLDALPVHRVAGDGKDGLLEVHVGLNERGDLVERLLPPTARALAERLAIEGVSLARGQIADVCLELDAFVAEAARVVSRGYLVFLDYGGDAHDVYRPERLNGTLKGFRDQRAVYDAFDRIGETDLTADVDFTTVTRAALAAGLEDAGRAQQGPWLRSLGIADYAGEHAEEDVDTLTAPAELGSAFEVACYRTRGLPDAPGFIA